MGGFTKIGLRSRFEAISRTAVWDLIEIELEDLVLFIEKLDGFRKDEFADFSPDGSVITEESFFN